MRYIKKQIKLSKTCMLILKCKKKKYVLIV